MRNSLLLLFCAFLSFSAALPPLFVESLAENPVEFREKVILVWENFFGEEAMLQMDAYIKENYKLFNTTSYMVPMSDGVELYTVVNFPFGHRGEPMP